MLKGSLITIEAQGIEQYIDAAVRQAVRPLEEQVAALLADKEKLQNDVYLTRTEAASLASVSEATISYWVKNGRIKNYGQGKRLLISKADLLNLTQ